MPIIIGNGSNPQNTEIADAFKRAADSIWGPGAAQQALLAAQTKKAMQEAYQLSDANSRTARLYNLGQGGDFSSPEARAAALVTGRTGDLNSAGLAATATRYGATDPRTQAAQVGAGQSYGNTYGAAKMTDDTNRWKTGQEQAGLDRRNTADIAGREKVAGMEITSKEGIERDKRNSELVTVPDPASPTGYRQVPRIKAEGMPVQPGSDVVKGRALSEALGYTGGQPQDQGVPQKPSQSGRQTLILRGPDGNPLPDPNASGSPLVAPPTMTGGTTYAGNGNDVTRTVTRPQPSVLGAGDKLAGLNPDTRTMLGLPTGNMEFLHLDTGEHAVSQNGGQTAVIDSGPRAGQTIPIQGSGFASVGGPTSFQDVQAMNARREMLKDLDQNEPTPQNSQVMGDLANLPAGAVRDVGGLLNAGAGLTGLNAFLPGGEVGADTNRATQRLAIFNNQIRRAFKNSEAFGIKEQRSVEEILPNDNMLSNPITEAKKIPELYKFLMDQRAQLRQYAKSLPASEIPKVLQAIHDNNKALQMITSPKWGGSIEEAAGGAPAPQGGGAPAPQGQGGFKILSVEP